MSFLQILTDPTALDGTAYVELAPGPFVGEFWRPGSLFFDEDTFGFFEGILRRHLPEYDHYAMTEVVSARWKPIVSELLALAAGARTARQPADLPADLRYYSLGTAQAFEAELPARASRLHDVAAALAAWIERTCERHGVISILGL